jgi:hypothetical protein
MLRKVMLVAVLSGVASGVNADTVDQLLTQYRTQGAGEFDATAGKTLWDKSYPDARGGEPRRCATCHTADLKQAGKHAQTGKRIEPMAPSVNAKRLTDSKFIEKWFLRNCKWTLGRECTPQEKGNVLVFLRSQ